MSGEGERDRSPEPPPATTAPDALEDVFTFPRGAFVIRARPDFDEQAENADLMNAISKTQSPATGFALGRLTALLDRSGALHLPDEATLVVADLHLEKGSAYAERGVFLPPYDTAQTLASLAAALERTGAKRVVALGDSFHDARGAARLGDGEAATLAALQRGRDWVWVAGNHDPHPPLGPDGVALPGDVEPELAIGGVAFRHEAKAEACGDAPLAGGEDGGASCEVSGHYHPVARLRLKGKSLRRRCFASDGRRLILPAFGAYAGGLNILDPVFKPFFNRKALMAHMLGDARVYAVGTALLLPD